MFIGGVMEERRDYVTLTLPAVAQPPQTPQASRSWRRVSTLHAPGHLT